MKQNSKERPTQTASVLNPLTGELITLTVPIFAKEEIEEKVEFLNNYACDLFAETSQVKLNTQQRQLLKRLMKGHTRDIMTGKTD